MLQAAHGQARLGVETHMANFRILALDGGGSWALIQVMALIDLYSPQTTGRQVLADFDLAAANSGGSIVLGGLLEDMTLGDLLGFFLSLKKRQSVFVPKLFHLPYTPKYLTVKKLLGLQAALPRRGAWLLADAAAEVRSATTGRPIHLLITGFDYDRNRSRFFRSAAAGGPGWGNGDPAQVQLAEAIHASTNAPVLFFDKPAQFHSEPTRRYWDGAIAGCNNPILAAVTEAVVLGHAPESLAALALGTGTVCLPSASAGASASPLVATPGESGILHNIQKLAGAILDDPPDVATFIAHVLAGGSAGAPAPAGSRIVRMNPMVAPMGSAARGWTFPEGLDVRTFATLAHLAMDAVAQDQVLAIQNLATLWLQDKVRNQPIRMNVDLDPELGQARYSQAKAAWNALRV